MNYRRLGDSGLKVSELCLGSWINFGGHIDDFTANAIIDTAVENGINFLDTADIYAQGKAEEVLGRWMRDKDRRTIVLATKCRGNMWPGPNGEAASRAHIMDACHDSLRRLQTDYIDLYQIHWPDGDTPSEETLRTLDDLVRAGKIRYFGWSNYSADRIEECAQLSEKLNLNKAISLQNFYTMLDRGVEEKETAVCLKYGLGQIPWSPLSQGLLTDKYLGGIAPEGSRAKGNEELENKLKAKLPIIKALAGFAHSREITLSQLALAWLLHQPSMASPIIGASRPEQVVENVKAIDIKLSTDDLAQLDVLLKSA